MEDKFSNRGQLTDLFIKLYFETDKLKISIINGVLEIPKKEEVKFFIRYKIIANLYRPFQCVKFCIKLFGFITYLILTVFL